MNLDKLFKDPIYFKIISFFHENPTSIDTPRGISTWVGEDKQTVQKALLKLSKMKLLTAHEVTSTTGYSYPRDQKVVKNIEKSIKKIKKEEGR